MGGRRRINEKLTEKRKQMMQTAGKREKEKKKRWDVEVYTALIGILAVLILFTGVWAVQRRNQTFVLKFGMFAGSYWDVPNGACYQVIDDAVARFEQKHPGVKVEYTSGVLKEDYIEWLSEQVLLGEEPDVFMIPDGEMENLISLNILKNLDRQIREDTSFSKEDYYPAAFAGGMARNGQYALPYECVPTLMFVNRTLLDQAGIPMPKENWTWDEFFEICKQVTQDLNRDGKFDQYGVLEYNWQYAMRASGIELFDANGTTSFFGDQGVEEAVSFLITLRALNQGHLVTSKEFDQGNVAFQPMTYAEYKTYKPYPWRIKKYSEFEWDCVAMPEKTAGAGRTALDTLLMGVSSRTKRENLAWEFLKELCYDLETQSQIPEFASGLPVIRQAVEQIQEEDINMAVVRDVMEFAEPMPHFVGYQDAMELADQRIQEMVDDGVALDTKLLKLQREINVLLKNGVK